MYPVKIRGSYLILSNRSFISPICYLVCLFFFLVLPLTSGAAVIQRYLYLPDQLPDADTGTGYESQLLNFAHCSDVHIIDEGNPIRAEELKVLVDSDPLMYLDLGLFLGCVIPPAQRDTGIYSALIWVSVIQAVNDEHLANNLQFIISTGDHTDTGIMDELTWFADLAEGRVPPAFKAGHVNRLGQRTIRPENPEPLLMPLYVAVGNHDIEYQGTFNNDGFIGVLIRNLAYDPEPDDYYINNLTFQEDVLEIEDGYGLSKDMTEPGYYSFDPSPVIHCIVLNTAVYYAPNTGWPLEPLSLGTLSITQFAWMKQEIENNADKLCIIFAHHGPDEFFPLSDDLKYYISGPRLQSALQDYENVIAYFNGHTHENSIHAVTTQEGGGYWDINTCGVSDYPQEWRTISLHDNGDGTGMISCRMHGHGGIFGTQEPYIEKDVRLISLEELGEKGYIAEGLPDDRDVDLFFKIPERVQKTIEAVTQNASTEETGAETVNGILPDSEESDDSRCFIMTTIF